MRTNIIFKPFVSDDPNFEYIQGYQKCMQDIMFHIQRQEDRTIDAVPILDGIGEALVILKAQLNLIQTNLKKQIG